MPSVPRPSTFREYDQLASQTDRLKGPHALALAMQGVLGETGGVLSAVKKHQRDKTSFEAYHRVVLEELGDTLWYLASIARHARTSLTDVARHLPGSRLPQGSAGDDVPFKALYSLDLVEEFDEEDEYLEELAKFGAEVGFLLSLPLEPLDTFQIRDQLAAALRELITVAHLSGVSLSALAASNIEKTFSRWPPDGFREFSTNFDDGAPEYERIPNNLDVVIRSVDTKDQGYFVYQSINNINIGDRLTDNIMDADFYRYHDVFHYANAAVLHWSPVLRSLLKVKRKYDKAIDENQDGARAIIIEEAITAYIFSRAKEQNFFEGVERGALSYDLLKTVRDLTQGYEVFVCPPWLWEEAILQGFEAFRFLRNRGSGIVNINRTTRRLSVRAIG